MKDSNLRFFFKKPCFANFVPINVEKYVGRKYPHRITYVSAGS